MSNRNSDVAHLYHESTKLFYLDLQRKPSAYKWDRALLPLRLPTEVSPLAVSALEAVAATEPAASPGLGPSHPGRVALLRSGADQNATFVGAGSCPCNLRLIRQPDKPGTIPSLLHLYEGVVPWFPISFSPSWC